MGEDRLHDRGFKIRKDRLIESVSIRDRDRIEGWARKNLELGGRRDCVEMNEKGTEALRS